MSDYAGAVHFYDKVVADDAYFSRLHEFNGTLVSATVHADADSVSVFESAFAGDIFHIEGNAGNIGSGGRRVIAGGHKTRVLIAPGELLHVVAKLLERGGGLGARHYKMKSEK